MNEITKEQALEALEVFQDTPFESRVLLKQFIEQASKEETLSKPAKIGVTTFREGVSSRLVVKCAQRRYEDHVKAGSNENIR